MSWTCKMDLSVTFQHFCWMPLYSALRIHVSFTVHNEIQVSK